MRSLAYVSKLLERYFTLILLIVSGVAFFYPHYFSSFSSWITNLLCLVMLGMGLTMKVEDFALVLQRPKEVLLGVGLRYLIMPLVGFGVAQALNLPPMLGAGLILVGCCPSGTASNVICFLAKGDVALSVTVASVNTLVAPLLLPILFLALTNNYIHIDAWGMFLDTSKVVLVPVVVGLGLRKWLGAKIEAVKLVIPPITILIMIFIIAVVVALSAPVLRSVAFSVVLAVALHNGLGLLGGYQIAKYAGLGERQARAICFEVGIEMSGLAVVLAIAHLEPVAAVPGAIFSVWHNMTGGFLANYWAKKPVTVDTSSNKEVIV